MFKRKRKRVAGTEFCAGCNKKNTYYGEAFCYQCREKITDIHFEAIREEESEVNSDAENGL